MRKRQYFSEITLDYAGADVERCLDLHIKYRLRLRDESESTVKVSTQKNQNPIPVLLTV